MNRRRVPGKALTPAHITGITAMALSGGLLFFWPDAATVPLGLFLLSCLVAPFLPRAGFFLPVTSRGGREVKEVALTFDDGPDPAVTPLLLDLLGRYRLTAAFFVTGRNAERYPGLVREILRRGHDIGNHSTRHDPLLMLRSHARLADEIVRTQELLAPFGIRPLAFRPPVGVTNPRLAGVLSELDMECVTFSCRAGDFGNRRIGGLARKILRKVHPGAIVLLHDVAPPGGGRIAEWLAGVEEIIRELRKTGYEIVPLPRLIGRAVMEALPASEKSFRQGLSPLAGTAERITASACVCADSAWYDGHFPDNPILPGIAILALVKEAIITSELREGRRVLITGLRRVRFRLPVRPGDLMTLEITREEKQDRIAYLFSVNLAGEPACTGTFAARPEGGRGEQTS